MLNGKVRLRRKQAQKILAMWYCADEKTNQLEDNSKAIKRMMKLSPYIDRVMDWAEAQSVPGEQSSDIDKFMTREPALLLNSITKLMSNRYINSATY